MQKEVGQRIKEIRISKGLTLKDVSEKAKLSVSYLSLIERGLTSSSITSLQNIADALGENVTIFFDPPQKNPGRIMRSYEHEVFKMKDSKFIYFSLASDLPNKIMDPFIVHLLPGQSREEVFPYAHEGEEFGYVLEGILTFYIDDKEFELYPGDSLHIPSTTPHNWANFTNKLVKLLYVSTPKVFD